MKKNTEVEYNIGFDVIRDQNMKGTPPPPPTEFNKCLHPPAPHPKENTYI